MSWKLISKLKTRAAAESGISFSHRGGVLRFCLIYPNHYSVAMGNLGFQSVYAMLNRQPEIHCERSFLPDPDELREYENSGTPLLSLESQQPVSGFDVIAFSVSFESDYLNIPKILRLAGILPFANARNGRSSLVIAGGAALFINPEPVADLLDVICLGEAEEILLPLLGKLSSVGLDRHELLACMTTVPGLYVPSIDHSREIARVFLRDVDSSPVATLISGPEAEFSDMHLVELTRGCPRGCRFCAAGFIYHPYRQRSFSAVKDDIDAGIAAGRKIGLVAAAVGDYHGIDELCRYIVQSGGSFSVSSLRIDGLDETMTSLLVSSGHKTATLAPEGGSQRLRDLVKKGIDEEQILAACQRLIEKDILNLKLYFIIGLPTETDDDISELLSLVGKIRELVIAKAKLNRRLGEITLSINPFIPKPLTPFQWCGMAPLKTLEKRLATIQSAVRRLANVSVQAESLKEAALQALLSRGGRDLADFLIKSDELGSWKKGAKAAGINIEAEVTRDIPLDEELPWGFIVGISSDVLKREYGKAFLINQNNSTDGRN